MAESWNTPGTPEHAELCRLQLLTAAEEVAPGLWETAAGTAVGEGVDGCWFAGNSRPHFETPMGAFAFAAALDGLDPR